MLSTWKRFSVLMLRNFLIVIISSCLWTCLCLQSHAQNWKTGGSFREALNHKIKFSSNGTLKDGLGGLSQNSRVAIFLDPDIDPSQKVSFPANLQPLGKTIDEVALKSRRIGYQCWFICLHWAT